jgi:hypothetical protein
MDRNSKLEKGIALIREAFADEAKRIEDEIIARVTGRTNADADSGILVKAKTAKGRKRAPNGAARLLVRRVLKAHPGANFFDIVAARQGVERGISESTIRRELDRGRIKTKEYVSAGGRYSLA